MSKLAAKLANSDRNPLVPSNVKQISSKPKTFVSKIVKPKPVNQNITKKKVIKV